MAGEVILRSRVLLKKMIADLDQLLLQLREARQVNVIKAEQKISSSASDALELTRSIGKGDSARPSSHLSGERGSAPRLQLQHK